MHWKFWRRRSDAELKRKEKRRKYRLLRKKKYLRAMADQENRFAMEIMNFVTDNAMQVMSRNNTEETKQMVDALVYIAKQHDKTATQLREQAWNITIK